MTAFINADLPSRVGLDVRKSIVLYDRNYLFNYALDTLPNERTLRSCITRHRFAIGLKEFDMTNGIPCEECYEQPASGDTAGGTGVVLRLLSPDAEATSHRAIMHAW